MLSEPSIEHTGELGVVAYTLQVRISVGDLAIRGLEGDGLRESVGLLEKLGLGSTDRCYRQDGCRCCHLAQSLAASITSAVSAVELLAPAKDLETGIAAIDCGADAVYVGAGRFSAREAAGNSLADIAALARHAHRYWARVYAAVNTILRDDELDAAVRLCHDLHGAGVDGLILQDVGLLECDLPPLPLIASTQMHKHAPERVAFLRSRFRARDAGARA